MPIVVDSSQWTGDQDPAPEVGPVVWGEFADRTALDQAAARLSEQEWFAAAHGPATAQADNDQLDPPDTDPEGANRRNLRQNFVGISSAATAMLAAGVVIGSGGAALPAVAAAAAAGASTAAVGEAAGTAGGSPDRMPETAAGAQSDGPALGIRTRDETESEAARRFLEAQGAKRIWTTAPGG